jgi:hypothetical protein
MKTRVLIIAFLIVSLICAFAFTSHAQCATDSNKTLIADETWLMRTKTGTKIQCYNESVFYDLLKSHGTLFKRFTCTWKTDRHGRYKEYIAYLSYEDAQLIVNWAKTNL